MVNSIAKRKVSFLLKVNVVYTHIFVHVPVIIVIIKHRANGYRTFSMQN